MTDTTAPVVKPRFKTQDFGNVEHKSHQFYLKLQPCHSMDDVNDPHLWRDILGKQVPGDTVVVFKPDSSEWAMFVIFEVSPNFVRLGKTLSAALPAVKEPDGPLKLKWNVGKQTHDVVRERDGYVLAKDFQTKAAAIDWITDHMAKTRVAA